MQYFIMTEAAPLSSSHVACLLALSGSGQLLGSHELGDSLSDFNVIMFFRKASPQTEGRRHADPLIKTSPE